MEKPGGGAATGTAAEQQASSLAAATADLPGSTDLNVHMAQEVASLAPEPWSKQETKTQVLQQQEQQQEQQGGQDEPEENSTVSQLPESYKKQEFAAPPKGAVTIAGRRLATGEIPEGEVINLKDFAAGGQEEGSEGSRHSGSAAGARSLALSDVQEVALTEEDTREAHNIAAAAAASAAALVHIGEPVRRAVNVAEVALDPSAAVDFDAATAAGPEAGRDEQPLSPSSANTGILDNTTTPPDATPGPLAHSTGELLAAHDASARAAAVAGALVHLGQTVPRAANMAEAAVEPADVVDFSSARTNAAVADTLPDIVASHAAAPVELGEGQQKGQGQQGQGLGLQQQQEGQGLQGQQQQQQQQQRQGQQEEQQQQAGEDEEGAVSPVLLTEESLEASGLGIGDVEPEAIPPAAHAADPALPMHTECEHVGAPAAAAAPAAGSAPIAAHGHSSGKPAGPAAASTADAAATAAGSQLATDVSLPAPPPPVAIKPGQQGPESAEAHPLLVMKQVTTLQYPGGTDEPDGSTSSSSREAGAAAAEAAAAAAAQAAAAAAAAAAVSGTDEDSTPHEQDVSAQQKSAEQRQQERIAAMADMCRNAAALGLTDANALMEQQPHAVVEAIAVQLVEGSDADSNADTTPVAVASVTATAGGDDESPAAEAGSTAVATVASSSDFSDLQDAAAVLAARLPALADPLTGQGGRAGNGLLPIDSGELPSAACPFFATALRDAQLSPRGAAGDEMSGKSAAGASTGAGGELGGKRVEGLVPELPSLECLMVQDLGPGFNDPDQLPRVEAGIATGIAELSAMAAGSKGDVAAAMGGKKGPGDAGDADAAGDARRQRDQGQQDQQGGYDAEQQGQGQQAQDVDINEREGGDLGLLIADVAIQGTAPGGSHRLKRAHDHAAHAAAVAAGLVHAGQPLREAADMADVATAPSEFVDATAAHVRMHTAHGQSDVLASGADVEDLEAGAGDDGQYQGLSGSATGDDMPINKTDLCMPLAVMASNELSDSLPTDSAAGEAEAAGGTGAGGADAPAAADVAWHNHASKAAAAAAALHFAGMPVAAAADVAEVATAPASAVEADSGASADEPSTPSSRARRHLLASGAVLHASASERSSSIAEGAEELPEWYDAELPASDVTNTPNTSMAPALTPATSAHQPATPGTQILNTNSALATELLSAKGGSGFNQPGAEIASTSNRSVNASDTPQKGDTPEPLSVSKHQHEERQHDWQEQQQHQGAQQQAGEQAPGVTSITSDTTSNTSDTAEAFTPRLLQSNTYDPDIIALANTGFEAELDVPQPLDNVSGPMLTQGLTHVASQQAQLPAAPSPAVIAALGGLSGRVGATGAAGHAMGGEGSSMVGGSNVSTAGGSQASLSGLSQQQEEQQGQQSGFSGLSQQREQQQGQQSGFGSSGALGNNGLQVAEPVAYVIDEPEAAAERAAVLISKGSMAAIMQDSTSAAGVDDAEAAAQSAAAALAGSTAEAVLGDEPGTQQGEGGRNGTAPAAAPAHTPATAAAMLPPAVPFSKGSAAKAAAAAAAAGSGAGGMNLARLASHGVFENVSNGGSVGSEGNGHRAASLASVEIPALPAPDADVTAGAALMPGHDAGGDYEGVHTADAQQQQGQQEEGQEQQQQEQGDEQLHVQQGPEAPSAGVDPAAVPLDDASSYAHTQQAAAGAVAREPSEQLHVLKGKEAPGAGDPASVPLGGGSHYAHTQQAVGGVGRESEQQPKLRA